MKTTPLDQCPTVSDLVATVIGTVQRGGLRLLAGGCRRRRPVGLVLLACVVPIHSPVHRLDRGGARGTRHARVDAERSPLPLSEGGTAV